MTEIKKKNSMMKYSDVIESRKSNLYRQWCAWKDGKPINDPSSARTRYASDAFIVHNTPRFVLRPGSHIYTIGSCFARNVERELAKCGFILPALELEVDPAIYCSPPLFPNTVLNKYTAHSTANEILLALGELSLEDDGLIETEPGKWYDLQTSHTRCMPREVIVELRRRLNKTIKTLPTCDVLVLTLGLTETWVDTKTGGVLNQLNASELKKTRERMVFFNSTVEESYDVLEHAISALHYVQPNIKVVITVSPVPLTQTFTTMDVVSANTYSKSVLRCVAQMLYEKFPFVDYYPSYEIVMNSPRSKSWYTDQTHVTFELVERVIGEFSRRYVDVHGTK